jgi:SAM-dependent methyltransferase
MQMRVQTAAGVRTIGTTLQIVADSLAEAAAVRAEERVLALATGNGRASQAAHRRHACVTAADAAAAEGLPFSAGAFDVVLWVLGAMFTSQHRRAAQELLRVTRAGGRIGLALWTPEGFVGELCNVVGRFVTPPPDTRLPVLCGSEPYIVKLFGPHASALHCVRRHLTFRYRSAAHWLEVFRWLDPGTGAAFAALEPGRRRQLSVAMLELLERWKVGGAHSLLVPAEYLETVVTKA